MSLKKFPIFRYTQNNTTFISLVLPLNIIDKVSEVLVYRKHDRGYQREPNRPHYMKLKKEILEDRQDFYLPTSIILGGNKEVLEARITASNNQEFLEIDTTTKLFRIVDGQHRIFGLREAAKEDESINEIPLNVVVILTEEDKRSKEIQIFTDINSKSKRINTDLAELAKHDYRIRENSVPDEDLNTHISIKAAYYLKATANDNVWQNGIKFDLHSDITLGIIGVKIFADSIESVTAKYLIDMPPLANTIRLTGKDLIAYTEKASDDIGGFLHEIWNTIIRAKWHGAFKEDFVKNDEGDLVKIFYKKDYYIQKGLGIKSLNPIIGEVVKDLGLNSNSTQKIKEIIFESKVKNEDWKNGGPFAGYNSESGFNKIKQIILNKINLPSVIDSNQVNLF